MSLSHTPSTDTAEMPVGSLCAITRGLGQESNLPWNADFGDIHRALTNPKTNKQNNEGNNQKPNRQTGKRTTTHKYTH